MIKLRAAAWIQQGRRFHCKDLKTYFGLDCCLNTIAQALSKPGKVCAAGTWLKVGAQVKLPVAEDTPECHQVWTVTAISKAGHRFCRVCLELHEFGGVRGRASRADLGALLAGLGRAAGVLQAHGADPQADAGPGDAGAPVHLGA